MKIITRILVLGSIVFGAMLMMDRAKRRRAQGGPSRGFEAGDLGDVFRDDDSPVLADEVIIEEVIITPA